MPAAQSAPSMVCLGQLLHGFAGSFRLTAPDGSFDQVGQRPPRRDRYLHLARALRGSQCISVTTETVAEDRPCPGGELRSVPHSAFDGVLGAGRHERQGIRPTLVGGLRGHCSTEYQPIPVASLSASNSAMIAVAASRSPHQAAYRPRPFNAMDKGASAPEIRASSTCLALKASQLFQSQSVHAANVARWPHWTKSLSETSSPRNVSTATRRLGAAAACPSVTSFARPSRNRSHGGAPSGGGGADRAACDTSGRRPPGRA